MKKILRCFVVIVFVINMLIIGCKSPTSDNYDETRINAIMYNIEKAYNDHDIDTLMQYIHIDYLHNGQSRWEIRELWLDRMNEYLVVDFQSINIDVHNDRATVSFTMKLQNPDETVYSDEPNTHGDLSYFIYDNSDWYVYGNQLLY